jgi:hypothetical protein
MYLQKLTHNSKFCSNTYKKEEKIREKQKNYHNLSMKNKAPSAQIN